MNMKSIVSSLVALSALSLAAATVENVVVRQQWPWNTRVNIDYTLTAGEGETWDVCLKVTDPLGRDVTGTSNAMSGDLDNVVAGVHQLVWDPAKGGCADSAGLMLKFELSLRKPLGPKYLVIDIANGIGGTYSTYWLDAEPSEKFTAKPYWTNKIVFRRCRAGSIIMGSPEGEHGRKTNETQHKVTFTEDFYMAIFPLTFGQAGLVWPVGGYEELSDYGLGQMFYNVAVNTLRDCAHNWTTTTDVSDDCFLGKLRTGLPTGSLPDGYVVCIPTESQWEYACRAGTTTAWNNGTDPDPYTVKVGSSAVECSDYNLDKLGVYGGYKGKHLEKTSPVTVGNFPPNAWGLYDMHGGVREIVAGAGGGWGPEDQVDPCKVGWDGGSIIVCGGSYCAYATECRASARKDVWVGDGAKGEYGIRLAIVRKK